MIFILGPIKSARSPTDPGGMEESAAAFGIVLVGLSVWTVLGAFTAIAKRLDDQVCLHNLRVEALALHRTVRRKALGLDGWDVDIIADTPDTTDYIDDQPEAEPQPARNAA